MLSSIQFLLLISVLFIQSLSASQESSVVFQARPSDRYELFGTEKYLNLYFELDQGNEGITTAASLRWLSDPSGQPAPDRLSGSVHSTRIEAHWNQTGWFYEICPPAGLWPAISGPVSLQQTDSGRVRIHPASTRGYFTIEAAASVTPRMSCQRFVTGSRSVPVVGEKWIPDGHTLVWSTLENREH